MGIPKNAAMTALLAALLVGVCPLSAAETGTGAGWPEFHGPNRDNLSPEQGLLKRWPQGGPRMIWKYSECGEGYSGVAIADGMIFTGGDFDDEEMLIALSIRGKLLWRAANGKSWRGASPGSRTTPTYDHGVLYQMNPTGRLSAYQAKSGKPIWSVDLQAEFGTRYGTWAMAENLVVDGDKVFCLPGGSRGAVVALDKRTGKTIWGNTEVNEGAAYCSPVVATYQGIRQMITMTQKSAVSIDVRTGELLWSYPHGRYGQNTTTPLFHDGHVLVTCGHSAGGTLLKINPDLRGVTRVWHKREFDNCHGGVVLVGGNFYGCGCRLGGKGFYCVDFLTGETKQYDRALGKVSITYADGMLYCLSDKGRMSLLAITPEGFRVVSQFNLPKLDGLLPLSHPVICGQRLYVRHDQQLYVYDVKAP